MKPEDQKIVAVWVTVISMLVLYALGVAVGRL